MRTPQEMTSLVERWYQLWNEGDKDAWLAHWTSFSPGDPILEDPVGTPLKHGWELAGELWDRTGGARHLKVRIEALYATDHEAAVVCRNEGYLRGEPLRIDSVDVWRLHPDGRTHLRSFWRIPPDVPYGVWTAATGARP